MPPADYNLVNSASSPLSTTSHTCIIHARSCVLAMQLHLFLNEVRFANNTMKALFSLCFVFQDKNKLPWAWVYSYKMKTNQKKEKKKKKAKHKEKKSWAIKITLKQLWSRSFLSLLPPWMGRRQLCEGQTGEERRGEHARRFNISILQCCLFYGRESLFVRSVSGLDIHETYFWDFRAFGIFMC